MATAEDIVQETAMRAFCHQPHFASPDELFWWCSTVANRLRIDEHRRTWRITAACDIPESRAAVDPSTHYEQREQVLTVLHEFVRLPVAQQEAFNYAGDRTAGSTPYVRRHRARARLLAALESLELVWLWVNSRSQAGNRADHASVVALASVAVSAVLAVGFLAADADPLHSSPGRSDSPASIDWSVAPRRVGGPTDASRSTSPEPAGRGVTVDAPADLDLASDTPVGRRFHVGAETTDERPPLACVNLVSLQLVGCVDYPTRP